MARRPAPPGVDRRQQILEAALDVFADEGFEGATTKAIAARADVTQGLIYFYFPSKEDLFFAAFAHQAQQVFEHLKIPDEESDAPPTVVIPHAIARFVAAMDSPRSSRLVRIMMRTATQHEGREQQGAPLTPLEEARCHIREQAQRIGAMFSTYLEAQIARGALRPVNTALATQFLVSSVMMIMVRRAAGDEKMARISRQELVDSVVGIFLHGLLPQPSTASPSPEARSGQHHRAEPSLPARST
jgi:AcrR family transcriptional regulator